MRSPWKRLSFRLGWLPYYTCSLLALSCHISKLKLHWRCAPTDQEAERHETLPLFQEFIRLMTSYIHLSNPTSSTNFNLWEKSLDIMRGLNLLLIRLIGCFNFTRSSPISSPLPLKRRDTSDPNWGCPFPGNSDLYGLGIRLGIYLQLLSTLLANATLSEQLREESRNTNAIIMVALFAGMVSATIENHLNSVEIYLMSMLLAAFLWSEFTPRHISRFEGSFSVQEGKANNDSYVLVRGKQRRTLKMRERISWSIPKDFLTTENDEVEDLAEAKKSYFAAIARSVFGTPVSLYNVWFWIYARHTLLRHGMPNQECIPLVFLNSQIQLSGNQVMLFIIVSVGHALFEVLFMVWWSAILIRATLRLSYEIAKIIVVPNDSLKISRLGRLKRRVADWYLEFAMLDDKKLKAFERIKLRRSTMDKLSRIRLYVPSFRHA